jgi:hypothetical protein
MKNSKAWTAFTLTTALATSLALGAIAYARPDFGSACHNRLEADRSRIDRDAARFGEHSRRVDHDVARMDQDRQWCRDHHADWDHAHFDVGVYFHH